MMNRTMKLLLLSDIFVLTGFGLIQPILAIYINDGGVTGGTMLTAGMASALFILTKSLVQLPFGHYVDSQASKERWLILGTLLMAAVPIIYLSASSIYHVYLAELIYGLGSGLAYPTWLGLWSVNLDRGKESFQWSIYHTTTGVGTAATGCRRSSNGQPGGLLRHLPPGRAALHSGLSGAFCSGAAVRGKGKDSLCIMPFSCRAG